MAKSKRLPDIVKRFEGLRVTDVCDGMDALGMQDIGHMNHDVRPLWRDTENFTHRFCGVAHTVRFVPTDRPVPAQTPEQFYEWMSEWYRTLAQGPINANIKDGDVIVIDGFECGTVGFIGSNNSLSWMNAGAVGIVTNGGCRDTDELIKERIPVFSRYVSKTIRPGRLELESTMTTINCAGAVVRPGDIIMADGDGVVVVPRARAEAVSEQAWRHAKSDRRARRLLYEEAGLEMDFTVDV